MQIQIQAHDLVISVMALIGVILLGAAALAVIVRVLGKQIPDIEEAAATWLLRDAAGWRARAERKKKVASAAATLEVVA